MCVCVCSHILVEITKDSTQKWGLAISNGPYGGLSIKNDPDPGSPAFANGSVKKGWGIESVNSQVNEAAWHGLPCLVVLL
jgi:hypothetical protein